MEIKIKGGGGNTTGNNTTEMYKKITDDIIGQFTTSNETIRRSYFK